MRHTDTATQAQETIDEDRGDAATSSTTTSTAPSCGSPTAPPTRAAGTRSNSPRGALAFKFAAEEKTTILADVIWDVGKIGKVAPVAVLEPVFVGGTTVTRATLANQEVIRARDVRIGDTVLVRRAGDVIPFVAGVLDAAKRTGEEQEIVPPAQCPSCGHDLTEQGNSRELYCTNVACPAQTVRRLIHWASRAAADIDAIGQKWIERLNEAGKLDRASDFYALDKETLLEFDRIGEVSAQNMIDSIERSKGVGLRKALIGFAIPMASEGTATKLCRHGFASLEAVADATRGGAPAGRGRRPEGRRQPAPAPQPRGHAQGDRGAARARREPRRARRGPAAEGRLRRPAGGQDRRRHRLDRRPAQRARRSRGRSSSASPSAPARRPPRSVSANTDMLITGADVGASKLTKAEKLEVEVVDQGEIWKLLIDAGVA